MPHSSLVSDQGGSLLHLFSLSNMPGKQLIKSAITLLKKGLMRKRAPLTREENPLSLFFCLFLAREMKLISRSRNLSIRLALS